MSWVHDNLWRDPNEEAQKVSCETQQFKMTKDVYDKLLGIAEADGMVVDGNTATFRGCTFDWLYDEATETLSMTCVKKPLLVTCNMISLAVENNIAKYQKDLI